MSNEPSIPIPFAIGETVWFAHNTPSYRTVACPECAGTKALTIIKGNGEQVSVACPVCEDRANGYYGPTGYVHETVYDFKPQKFTCNRVSIYGSEISYSESRPDANCYSSVDANNLYRDYDVCLARCQELVAQHEAEDERRVLANIRSKREHLAFSVSYWSKEVKKLERELQAARDRLCVSREMRKDNISSDGAEQEML